MDNLLVHGDASTYLRTVEDDSIDCIYADPPFGTGRHFTTYTDVGRDEFVVLLDDLLTQSARILKPGAPLWLHLSASSADVARTVLARHEHILAATVHWERVYSPRASANGISGVLDTIFAISFGSPFIARPLPFTDDQQNLHRSWDGDTKWISGDFSAPRADQTPDLVYGITSPFTNRVYYPKAGRHWTQSAPVVLERMKEWTEHVELRDLNDFTQRSKIVHNAPTNLMSIALTDPTAAAHDASERIRQGHWPSLFFGRTGAGGPRIKRMQDAPGRIATTLWPHDEVGHIQLAKSEVAHVSSVPFSTPKPEALLRRIITMSTNEGDTVLDPFAGSGTTAVAAHHLRRRWIVIERDEPTIRTYIQPRIDAVVRGEHPYIERLLEQPLPFTVRTGEAERAAQVLTALNKEGRLNLNADELNRARRSLRAAEATYESVLFDAGGAYRLVAL